MCKFGPGLELERADTAVMEPTLTPVLALLPQLAALGWRLLAAVAALLAGVALIRLAGRLAAAALVQTEPWLAGFVLRTLNITLSVLLVVALLGLCGLQVASFAALLVGAGLAVGGAMAGLFGDFAAGLVLMALRPFDVGDEISVAGITGQVDEIGVFRTRLTDDSHVFVSIPNSKLAGDSLERRRAGAVVRVRCRLALCPDTDIDAVAARLLPAISKLDGILASPPVRIRAVDFGTAQLIVEIRAHCAPVHEDAVAFAINRLAATLPRALPEPARVHLVLLQQ